MECAFGCAERTRRERRYGDSTRLERGTGESIVEDWFEVWWLQCMLLDV